MDEWVIVNSVYVCKVTNLADFEKISKKKGVLLTLTLTITVQVVRFWIIHQLIIWDFYRRMKFYFSSILISAT